MATEETKKADLLANEGAEKDEEDTINLEVDALRLTGVSLSSMTQSRACKALRERRQRNITTRPKTAKKPRKTCYG
ncbi:hypothetical protein ARMSODRAFT_966364 [Armillaria solidipes]|uniref:Uncharacterized protein n=1 Tax=Armillaria solidipes TaxID=1076256 RepID=A0A2H3ATY1_9AGAR|nr:hypothetical protein ARMSODRAFT_966364 [Armillaria solidipes]